MPGSIVRVRFDWSAYESWVRETHPEITVNETLDPTSPRFEAGKVLYEYQDGVINAYEARGFTLIQECGPGLGSALLFRAPIMEKADAS